MKITVGTIIRADILDGDETDGAPAGLLPGYRLRGIGRVPMRAVHDSSELTELCRPEDTTWGAVVTAIPADVGDSDDPCDLPVP